MRKPSPPQFSVSPVKQIAFEVQPHPSKQTLADVPRNPSNKSLRKSPSQSPKDKGTDKKVAFKKAGMFSPYELREALIKIQEPMIQI